MPKQVFLIADITSAEFLSGRAIPKQMIEDMLAISSVPTEDIANLAEALERESGFPTMKRLAQLVSESIPEKSKTSPVQRALVNLWPERVEPLLRELDEWRTVDPKNAEQLPDRIFTAIRERLTQLIRDFPVLKRFRKSRRLIKLTGSPVQEVQILCDIRPVFDEDRKVIEGLIPLITLKLGYEGQDEETKVLEALLSAEILDELLDKANKAKQKLAKLQDSVREWLPDGWVESE